MEAIDVGLAMGFAAERAADFSADGETRGLVPAARSKGTPGVLGVLAEPKAANAPDPSPNGFDAGVVDGDARVPPGVFSDSNGFDLPCDEASPYRFAKDALRLPGPLSPAAALCEPLLDVDRESFAELGGAQPLETDEMVAKQDGKGTNES
jgi:hypothetical protein